MLSQVVDVTLVVLAAESGQREAGYKGAQDFCGRLQQHAEPAESAGAAAAPNAGSCC